MTRARRPPLILTGGPAVGKTSTGRALAQALPRAAFVDADDVRQLVVSGLAAVWEGPDGERQMDLAAHNVAALVRNLHAQGFDVVVADVVDQNTLPVYRRELPDALVVRLTVSLPEAHRRAQTRPVWLTPEEFQWLHRRDREDPPAADATLAVDGFDLPAQVAAVRRVWDGTSRGRLALLERFRWLDGHADVWRVFSDGPSLAALVGGMVAPWRTRDVTHVVGVESRGFLLGAACAVALGVGFVGIRKDGAGLLPGEVVVERTSRDYRGREHVLRMQRSLGAADRVLVVDDWAERGSQARAARSLVDQCGATYLGLSVAVDELDDATRTALGPVSSLALAEELVDL